MITLNTCWTTSTKALTSYRQPLTSQSVIEDGAKNIPPAPPFCPHRRHNSPCHPSPPPSLPPSPFPLLSTATAQPPFAGFIEYMEETLATTLAPLVANLRSIHLHWNTCITDEFLSWLAESMPRLEVRSGKELAGKVKNANRFLVGTHWVIREGYPSSSVCVCVCVCVCVWRGVGGARCSVSRMGVGEGGGQKPCTTAAGCVYHV